MKFIQTKEDVKSVIRRIWDVTLAASDLTRAVDFYEDTLGLQEKYSSTITPVSIAEAWRLG
ncbi:MAG: hypothetical protein AMJ41_00565 [candidate division Zixibacteria bacterium DG_27]|nr:MAG: hypothetical protein AMJ41_00565 [candidate division Zixibacteria bacterium DG_27]